MRTIGTNRARMIARPPYRSKKPYAFSTYSGLNRRESGRWNTLGPAFLPMT